MGRLACLTDPSTQPPSRIRARGCREQASLRSAGLCPPSLDTHSPSPDAEVQRTAPQEATSPPPATLSLTPDTFPASTTALTHSCPSPRDTPLRSQVPCAFPCNTRARKGSELPTITSEGPKKRWLLHHFLLQLKVLH